MGGSAAASGGVDPDTNKEFPGSSYNDGGTVPTQSPIYKGPQGQVLNASGQAAQAAQNATKVDPTSSEAKATGQSASAIVSGLPRGLGVTQNMFSQGFGLLDDTQTRKSSILGF